MIMKEIKIMSEGDNYTAIDLGEFDSLKEYSYLHPKLNQEIPGKVFIGEALKTTGAEISLQVLPPDTEIPFLHGHRKHEEIYIFLKGCGEFQVDNVVFKIKEGSIVRIAPEGKRTWRNNSNESMTFMVVQTQAGQLDSHYIDDGFRINEDVIW